MCIDALLFYQRVTLTALIVNIFLIMIASSFASWTIVWIAGAHALLFLSIAIHISGTIHAYYTVQMPSDKKEETEKWIDHIGRP